MCKETSSSFYTSNDVCLQVPDYMRWVGLVLVRLQPVPARYYIENVKTGHLCANPLSTRENAKDGGCIQ